MVASVAITTVAMTLMVALAAESIAALLALGVGLFGIAAAAVGPWRAGLHRRRLRHRVGDPGVLQGEWRRLLAAAWRARDDFARATAELGSSPLRDRLAGQQYAVDSALEHCGALARNGLSWRVSSEPSARVACGASYSSNAGVTGRVPAPQL
jgi:hypothetical protein